MKIIIIIENKNLWSNKGRERETEQKKIESVELHSSKSKRFWIFVHDIRSNFVVLLTLVLLQMPEHQDLNEFLRF